jgi:hypothetical protein
VRFYKEGTGLLTKYDPSKMKVLGPSTIAEDEDLENDWLDFVADNPLPEVLNFYDYDHIKATFDGQVGKRDDDDEKPVSRKVREVEEKPAARRARPEPEDEDEVEEEKPKPRTRARAEPEDEPEEKPVRRTRPKVEEDDTQEELPLPRSRRGKTEPEEDDDGEEKVSLREKIARRRSRPSEDD